MAPPRVLIAGGAGVFGQRLARELLDTCAAHLVLAGRRPGPLRSACATLDPARTEALVLDLHDPAAFARAAAGCTAIACTAGPFGDLPPALPGLAIAAGAHWVDIADDPDWVGCVLGDEALARGARAAGKVVAPGCSSVPTLSGVLVRACRERLPGVIRARITLFIGNRNRKGVASLARALASGGREAVPVQLPPPFGVRPTFAFGSPDAALLREDLRIDAEFRAGFEATLGWRLAGVARPLGRLLGLGRLARAIAWLTRPAGRFGSPDGVLQAEAWDAAGTCEISWVRGRDQRMPILPAAEVLRACLAGTAPAPGVARAWTWWPPADWLARLAARGLEVSAGPPAR